MTKELVENNLNKMQNLMENFFPKDCFGELKERILIDNNLSEKINMEDQLFYEDEINHIYDLMIDLSHEISYLKKPILREDVLVKNGNGRYEINSFELNCGNVFEFLNNDIDDNKKWVKSVMKHNGKNYYPESFPNIEIDNLKARVRY